MVFFCARRYGLSQCYGGISVCRAGVRVFDTIDARCKHEDISSICSTFCPNEILSILSFFCARQYGLNAMAAYRPVEQACVHGGERKELTTSVVLAKHRTAP
jgi:hypothetical protein